MRAKIKIEVYDKYSQEKERRIETLGPVNLFGERKVSYTYKKEKQLLCSPGDIVEIITVNPGEHSVVVIVENKSGHRFVVKWDDLCILN